MRIFFFPVRSHSLSQCAFHIHSGFQMEIWSQGGYEVWDVLFQPLSCLGPHGFNPGNGGMSNGSKWRLPVLWKQDVKLDSWAGPTCHWAAQRHYWPSAAGLRPGILVIPILVLQMRLTGLTKAQAASLQLWFRHGLLYSACEVHMWRPGLKLDPFLCASWGDPLARTDQGDVAVRTSPALGNTLAVQDGLPVTGPRVEPPARSRKLHVLVVTGCEEDVLPAGAPFSSWKTEKASESRQ